jgi:SAM-dependent methyltransferase
MTKPFHEDFYSFAKYYDIAFDFKNVPQECDFLEHLGRRYGVGSVGSFIEFAAGPALHALEFAKRGAAASAVDLSPEMVAYGRWKAAQARLPLHYDCADMVTYQSASKFDVAAILMDSTAYLLTNDQVIAHLRSVAKLLNPGGLYVLEMSHPRSVFDIARSTVNDWEMNRDGVRVQIQWGSPTDVFDPITQITEGSVRLEYHDGDRHGVLESSAPQRCFTATEFEALVAASGCFEIAEIYGAMDAVPFSNDPKAWRMIPVLRVVTQNSHSANMNVAGGR